MDKGYIKLYRSILDNPVVTKDPEHLAVWIYLLCEATHKERSIIFGGKRITLNPGQFTTGRKQIAQRMGISESKVQRILKRFESEQQIEQQTYNKCRLISIVNWSEYQQGEQQNEQQVNNNRTSTEQQLNTKQECKNVKNAKNGINIYEGMDPKLYEAVKAFEEMRTKMKKPMTDRAKELMLMKLQTLSGGDVQKGIAIIEQSIERGWAGVFALDGGYRGRTGTNWMEADV